MKWRRTEGDWNQLTGNLKRQWEQLVESKIDLWAGKRDRARLVARRHAGTEEPNDANQGGQS
jgi:uncharacterized protein YjbJ (UPF0337 family)